MGVENVNKLFHIDSFQIRNDGVEATALNFLFLDSGKKSPFNSVTSLTYQSPCAKMQNNY